MSKSAGGGNNKSGRNAAFCLRYRNEGRREINKMKRVKRHLRRFVNDYQSRDWVRGAS